MESAQELQLKSILTNAVKSKASDIHFSVGNSPILRVGDGLVSLDDQDVITQDFMELLTGLILSEEQKKKLADNKELILTYNFDKDLRFKINLFYQRGMLSASLRHIPSQVPSLSSLGLGDEVIELANLKKGLVILAGPFGSGRSTTAAALIEEINRNRKEYIITIENNSEYLFVNRQSIIEQREIGRDTRSFADALNYFQEENGDVLFLEEINDPEVIPMILEIARGSSLVIACLGADSASKVIARILDSFQSFDQERVRDLLSTALKAILCQKLLPQNGGGMIVAYELLKNNDSVKSMILSGSVGQLDNLIQTSKREGMISFEQSLANLVKTGKISKEDAEENVNDKNALDNLLS